MKLLCASERNRCNPHPAQDGDYSGFAFSEQTLQAAFWQFVYAPARKMRDCKGRSRLSARSALQSVSRFEVSTGDPRPFAAGFPIGARSIPVGTRFCFAKSSVLYLCFRLTRERGWRHTLRCGRVWQQTLFRGSRTGGFCDGGYGTNAGFLRSKIRLAGKGGRGIYKLSSRRSDVPCFSVSSVFPCHGSWSFSRVG